MAKEELDAKTKTPVSPTEIQSEAFDRAKKTHKEVKRQADIVRKEAKELAVDKQAKKDADQAYGDTVKQAKKDYDTTSGEAQRAFIINYEQSLKDRQEAIAKSGERTDRAQKAYEGAKKQADIVHREVKEKAVDKHAKKEADKAHKDARKQAQKDYDEAIEKRE